jgi:hypothetical protein
MVFLSSIFVHRQAAGEFDPKGQKAGAARRESLPASAKSVTTAQEHLRSSSITVASLVDLHYAIASPALTRAERTADDFRSRADSTFGPIDSHSNSP